MTCALSRTDVRFLCTQHGQAKWSSHFDLADGIRKELKLLGIEVVDKPNRTWNASKPFGPRVDFIKHFDPSGLPYYHNETTAVTQWEKPDGWDESLGCCDTKVGCQAPFASKAWLRQYSDFWLNV